MIIKNLRVNPLIIGNNGVTFDQNTLKDLLSITFTKLFQYLPIMTFATWP